MSFLVPSFLAPSSSRGAIMHYQCFLDHCRHETPAQSGPHDYRTPSKVPGNVAIYTASLAFNLVLQIRSRNAEAICVMHSFSCGLPSSRHETVSTRHHVCWSFNHPLIRLVMLSHVYTHANWLTEHSYTTRLGGYPSP